MDGWMERRRPARSKQRRPKPFIVPSSMVRRSDQPLATKAPLQQLEVNRSQRPNWGLAEPCPNPISFFFFSFFLFFPPPSLPFPSPTLPLSHVFSRRHLARPLNSRRPSLRSSDLAFCGPPPSLHCSHDTALALVALRLTRNPPRHHLRTQMANAKINRTPQTAEILHVRRPTPTHSNRP
ncbi:hypothetical protein IWX90DRAFT_133706 [Phyllosticta citrichinensis]|uniref:Uncharacterized protein n=1 Tax=Phyllosticta citrichinensis TaxID=1130410 RepID=A0ABR1Y4N4_9PEZI